MKRALLFIALALLAVFMSACSGDKPIPPGDSGAWSHNNDGVFDIKIYTDKETYHAGEPIKCSATVEYVGGGDSIKIISAGPLVSFSLYDGKYFTGGYFRDDTQTETELKKGVPVTYEFEKLAGWKAQDPNTELYDLLYKDFYEQFYKEKELKLLAGEYRISAGIDCADAAGAHYELSADVLLNVEKAVKIGPERTIILIVVGIGLFVIPSLLVLGTKRKQINSWWHLNDYEPTREDTFEEKIEKAKMQPKSVIIFGQNNFACDDKRKKILVQSVKTTGVLLDYKDIVSYELIKDGQTIRRGGGGESVRMDASGKSVSAGDGKPLCSDLKLVIKTRKASSPEVVLPFISFSIDSEFAYNEALQAASEAAEELENII